MKTSSRFHFIAAVLLAVLSGTPAYALSVAREWNEEILAAIRANVPNPPAHARNLFHTAVVMYDAWAAFDRTATGYIYNEKLTVASGTIETARHEAISYAAHRLLRARFAAGASTFDAKLNALGYSSATATAALSNAATPAELGKRIGNAILVWSGLDGFTAMTGFASTANYPQAYTAAVNPNLILPLNVQGTNAAFVDNQPLGFGIPAATDPNFWQPLALASSIAQNGIPIPAGTQTFVGVQSLATTPFSLTRTDPLKPWLDPFGGPTRYGTATGAAYKAGALGVLIASSQLNDPTLVNISPAALGNNPPGTDNGTGYATNPITGGGYNDNYVKRGDYTRVLAEFWADGPQSETPPGHWHVLANEVADNPLTVKQIDGLTVNDLEWDIKVYFALSGATHDAACAAWALKRYYSGPRPITMIRYLGANGQLPLMTDVSEAVTVATAAPGGKHHSIWDVNIGAYAPGDAVDYVYNFNTNQFDLVPRYIGRIAVFSWPGEHPANAAPPAIAANQNTVRWMMAKDWLPFQRKTFNTPAFPGYVSGHSTFSRAAAEVLAAITGSPYFPGGYHHHTIAANTLTIDRGPSADVDLQWASYYDAADQAGQSRRYGGIHVSEDDYHGRFIGSIAGKSAYVLAQKYWTGNIYHETLSPAITHTGTTCVLTWKAQRGMYHKVQTSLNMLNWTDATTATQAYTTTETWTDTSPNPKFKFYRVVWSAGP
jgi:hypothetical protein